MAAIAASLSVVSSHVTVLGTPVHLLQGNQLDVLWNCGPRLPLNSIGMVGHDLYRGGRVAKWVGLKPLDVFGALGGLAHDKVTGF